ncbi:dehydrogenase [Litorimonas cladophorae]|uniref:Dehydrogenase n=1 Tax=Litorimonas cladophorae TaxID=1220491 RepID=A0A918KCH2_9PROT|nr:SDR family oxidoreductase [Litorimonas cladophorae]GGX58702.1 dehydrogenase [Litorimonas cladophorae]
MFKNQIIAITGASGGIGRGIAEMFIAEGAKVAISDLSLPSQVATEIGATPFVCDVSDEASVKDFIHRVEAELGPIDVYVSNAGVGSGNGRFVAAASNESWEQAWQVNVMGSVYAARELMPNWVKRKSGRFVITASAAGLLNQIGSASYSSTKHAAVSLAESIAIEHSDDGIKSNCICPQYVRSNMTKGMSMAEGSQDGLLEPKDVANALKAAIIADEFFVFPHPVVQKYFINRAMHPDAYLSGMRKLKAKVGQAFAKKG